MNCVAPVVFRLRLLSIDRCSFTCFFPYFIFQLSFVPLSVFHIPFPLPYLISSLPYLISPFLTPISYLPSPISYLLPSPLSHISSLSPFSSPLLYLFISPPFLSALYLLSSHPLSFPLLPHLFHLSFPFLFSPYPNHQDGIIVLPGGTSRPRWCNAQECMERPMSVYTFARPSPASSAVSSLSGVWGSPWSCARPYTI